MSVESRRWILYLIHLTGKSQSGPIKQAQQRNSEPGRPALRRQVWEAPSGPVQEQQAINKGGGIQ